MNKLIVKNYRDEVFKADVTLLVGNIKESEHYLKKFVNNANFIDAVGEVITMENKLGHKKRIIWILDKNNQFVLVHELIHLVRMIFEDKGIHFEKWNDELIAYYQEFWFKKIWRDLQNG